MPLFHYQTIDTKGKKQNAVLEAPSLAKAKETLRQQRILVLKLTSEKKRGLSHLFSKGLSKEKLTLFTTQLAELIKAKLPLYQSLSSLADQAEGEKERTLIHALMESIKEGSSLSEAMKLYPKSFSFLYRAMVEAGERVGKLDASLAKLALYLQKSAKMKKKLTTALLYPLVLALFSLIVIFVMLLFVIPSLESIFVEENVNRFTAIVMGGSRLLREGWPYLLLGICALLGYGGFLFRKPYVRAKVEEFILTLPLLKGLILKVAATRFTRTLSSLLEGGVPMIEALTIAKEVTGYPLLAKEIAKAQSEIIEGSSLSQELAKIWWMPKLVSQMAAVGEESGTLSHMLQTVSELYEEEIEKKLTRLTELAQPIILLVMGVIVGVIMLAVLIPLTDATSLL